MEASLAIDSNYSAWPLQDVLDHLKGLLVAEDLKGKLEKARKRDGVLVAQPAGKLKHFKSDASTC